MQIIKAENFTKIPKNMLFYMKNIFYLLHSYNNAKCFSGATKR
jgi:hypothetical protein